MISSILKHTKLINYSLSHCMQKLIVIHHKGNSGNSVSNFAKPGFGTGTVSTSSGSQQMQVATYGPINLGQYGNPYYSTWFCFWIFDPKYKFILNYIEQPFFVATQIIYTTGFCIALLCCLVLMTKCCIRNSYGDLVISMICGVLGIVSSKKANSVTF